MSEPATLEGWQTWQSATGAITVPAPTTTTLPMLDQGLALRRAELLGFDLRAVTLLLPWIAAGLAKAGAEHSDFEEPTDDRPPDRRPS